MKRKNRCLKLVAHELEVSHKPLTCSLQLDVSILCVWPDCKFWPFNEMAFKMVIHTVCKNICLVFVIWKLENNFKKNKHCNVIWCKDIIVNEGCYLWPEHHPWSRTWRLCRFHGRHLAQCLLSPVWLCQSPCV